MTIAGCSMRRICARGFWCDAGYQPIGSPRGSRQQEYFGSSPGHPPLLRMRPLSVIWYTAIGSGRSRLRELSLDLLGGALTCNEFYSNRKYLIIREMAATPREVLLVASLCKNGQRNEPRGLIRSLEPTVRKDSLIVLPSSIGLQFVRKLQMLRHSDYVRILVRPNFPVTCDGHSLAGCEEPKIFDGCKGTQVILNAGVILKDLHPLPVHNYVGGLTDF